jgi:UDP-N-acetylmuramoylalanine--D-glutamate ligase
MDAYERRPLTLIAGGFDRGIDYAPLVEYVVQNEINAVVCMGQSGQRIFDALKKSSMQNIAFVLSMADAVREAKNRTPDKGVILLSPASPSYDMFKNHIERAACFAKESGFA